MIRHIMKIFWGFSVKTYLQKQTVQGFFLQARKQFLPNGLYIPTKQHRGCPIDRFGFHPFITTPYEKNKFLHLEVD